MSSTQTLPARSGSGLLQSLACIAYAHRLAQIDSYKSRIFKEKIPRLSRGISIYQFENLAVLLTLLAAVLTTLLAAAALLLSALTTRCLILLTGFLLTTLLTTLLLAALLFATHYVSP
jgi:hypothetical protein